ncbi:MAG: hypothetical protein U9O97_06870 [Elusimicrobiota bacterium]|nr:hypothetical protein [Elusimicrobiota bacterium]
MKIKDIEKKLRVFALLICFAVFASANPGNSCFEFLDVPFTAKLAVSPLQTGPAAAGANPALAGVDKTAMEFSYAKWLGNLDVMSAGFGQRLSNKFSLAAYGAVMNLSESLKAYDEEGIPSGEAEYSNYRYAAALSFRAADSMKLGAAVTSAGEDLDGDAYSAVIPSAGFEMRFRRTALSVWHSASLGKIDYNGDKFPPLSVTEVNISEHFEKLALSMGLRSSETSGVRAGVKYRFENIVMEGNVLSESESDLIVSAGVSFEFKPVTVDLSYFSRGDAGSSIFSTVRYEFDMPGFAKKISKKIAKKKKEAKRYVKAGSISDIVADVSAAGEKRFWINFNSEISVSENFVVSRENRIIARGAVMDRLSEKPLVYEALIMGQDVIKEPHRGDIIAVSQKQIKEKKERKAERKKKESRALEKRIDGQKELLKTADLMRWNSSEPLAILERVSALRKKGKLKDCGAKLLILEASVKKLFEDNIKAMISEAGSLAKTARKVGVNVSYPESLTLKAEGSLKNKNYKEALGNISESLSWLNKILDEIENE